MDLLAITLTLCLSLLVMLTPSAAFQQKHVQSSYHAMPRKLRLVEEVKVNVGSEENLSSYDKHMRGSFSGKRHCKELGTVRARGSGTMQEWRKGTDPSQFFTMDYSNVRRRRPVHNKSLPVGDSGP